jgi:hypothetical protein
MTIQPVQANKKVLAIGAAFLIPPAWIVFQGLQNLAGFPMPVALFALAGLAAIAVTLIFLGLQNLEAGDVKDARVQFGGAFLIMVSEFAAQWWFAITEHHALVTALVLSVLSVGGAVVIESEIMRVWKANARRSGLISLPRAQVPREVVTEYPEVAAIARRTAIRFPNATQESILAIAFAEYDKIHAADVAQAAVPVRVDVRDLMSGQSALGGGQSAGQAAIESAPADDTRTVSALVTEGVELHGADKAAVTAYVMARKSAANPDTVRKATDRALKLRVSSTYGKSVNE